MYLIIWRFFIFAVALSRYLFNVIGTKAFWTLVISIIFLLCFLKLSLKHGKNATTKSRNEMITTFGYYWRIETTEWCFAPLIMKKLPLKNLCIWSWTMHKNKKGDKLVQFRPICRLFLCYFLLYFLHLGQDLFKIYCVSGHGTLHLHAK